jgi:hypothetical protein
VDITKTISIAGGQNKCVVNTAKFLINENCYWNGTACQVVNCSSYTTSADCSVYPDECLW